MKDRSRSTLIVVSVDHAGASWEINHAELEGLLAFARVVADQVRSTLDLANYVTTQIQARQSESEAQMRVLVPGYAAEVDAKLAVLALGMLVGQKELRTSLAEALHQRVPSIDIVILPSRLEVSWSMPQSRSTFTVNLIENDGVTSH